MSKVKRSSPPLSEAIKNNNLPMVKFQLLMGEDPNEILSTNTNPFFMALERHNIEIINTLINYNLGTTRPQIDFQLEINGTNAAGFTANLAKINEPNLNQMQEYKSTLLKINEVYPICKGKISGDTILSLALIQYLDKEQSESKMYFADVIKLLNELGGHKCLENHNYYNSSPIFETILLSYCHINIISFDLLKSFLDIATLEDFEKKINLYGNPYNSIEIAILYNNKPLLDYLIERKVNLNENQGIMSKYVIFSINVLNYIEDKNDLEIFKTLIDNTKGMYSLEILDKIEKEFSVGKQVIEIIKNSPNYQLLNINLSNFNSTQVDESILHASSKLSEDNTTINKIDIEESQDLSFIEPENYIPSRYIITIGDCEKYGCYISEMEF